MTLEIIDDARKKEIRKDKESNIWIKIISLPAYYFMQLNP